MTETRILKITTKGTKKECAETFHMLESICDIEIEYCRTTSFTIENVLITKGKPDICLE